LRAVYTIAGRDILIDAQDDWSTRSIYSFFSQSFLQEAVENGDPSTDALVRIQFGTTPPPIPAGLVSFEIPEEGICHTDGQILQLDFNGSRVDIGPGVRRRAEVWITRDYQFGSSVLSQIFSQALCGVLRRCDVYPFHSAGVVPPGHDKALLIAGPSGSGKTTLTLQLAACGWNYLADDTLVLRKDHQFLEAYALRKFFALRMDTIGALQLSQLQPTSTSSVLKVRVAPQNLFSSNQLERARTAGIIFPVLTEKPESDIRRLDPAEAMTKLLRLAPWAGYDKPTATKYLRFLADLANECAAFELLAGTDLLQDRLLAAELCSTVITT